MQKTVSMNCHTCHTPVKMLAEAHDRLTTGTGMTLREHQRMQVQSRECGVEVTTGSLLTHCQRQHGVGRGYPPVSQGSPNLPGLFTETYIAALVPGRGVPGWGTKPDQTPG